MSENRMVEQFKLLKRAKKLEQMGSNERALELYLELHEKYEPNTSDAYERPSILLERYKRYDEALKMCEEAIEEINHDRMSGTVDKFEKRIESIKKKMQTEPVKNVKTEHYTFGIIGFRSKSKVKMIVSGIFYILLVASIFLFETPFIALALFTVLYGFTYLIDLITTKSKAKIAIFILMSIMFSIAVFAIMEIPSAFEEPIELESKEEHLEGGENIFKPKDDLPIITDENIEDARERINKEIEVIESLIIVNEGRVTFGLLLDPSTDKERAVELSEIFVEELSHLVASEQNLKGPSFGNLGELYDHYSVLISAGVDDENILAKGQKAISSKFINWRD